MEILREQFTNGLSRGVSETRRVGSRALNLAQRATPPFIRRPLAGFTSNVSDMVHEFVHPTGLAGRVDEQTPDDIAAIAFVEGLARGEGLRTPTRHTLAKSIATRTVTILKTPAEGRTEEQTRALGIATHAFITLADPALGTAGLSRSDAALFRSYLEEHQPVSRS